MHEPLATEKWKTVAAAFVQIGVFTLGAEIWARSGFRCEYCDTDLLVSPQSYGLAASDHILPKSKYPLLKDDFNNYANTCGLCNKLKRNWDPGGDKNLAKSASLSEPQRSELIARCREYLTQSLAKQRDDIQRIKTILRNHQVR